MGKTKEALYQSIGEVIAECIEDTWNKARVTFDVLEEDVYGMECSYETIPDKSEKSFAGGIRLYDLFLELRQAMEEDGSATWRKAVFELSSSGVFDLDFEYSLNGITKTI